MKAPGTRPALFIREKVSEDRGRPLDALRANDDTGTQNDSWIWESISEVSHSQPGSQQKCRNLLRDRPLSPVQPKAIKLPLVHASKHLQQLQLKTIVKY